MLTTAHEWSFRADVLGQTAALQPAAPAAQHVGDQSLPSMMNAVHAHDKDGSAEERQDVLSPASVTYPWMAHGVETYEHLQFDWQGRTCADIDAGAYANDLLYRAQKVCATWLMVLPHVRLFEIQREYLETDLSIE